VTENGATAPAGEVGIVERIERLEAIACELGRGLVGVAGSGVFRRSPTLRGLVEAQEAADPAAIELARSGLRTGG
jgi:hypothetical protein